jgi:ATP-dependent Clp protease protease subunit
MRIVDTPKTRRVLLSENVTKNSVTKLIEFILEIQDYDKQQTEFAKLKGDTYTPAPIELLVDSYGGSIYAANSLIALMLRSKTPIHTIGLGTIMSAGLSIFLAGSKRFAYDKWSTFMYHEGFTFAFGKIEEIKENMKEMQRLDDLHLRFTVERTNISEKKLKKIHKAKTDWYIDSKEARELGIIHDIL